MSGSTGTIAYCTGLAHAADMEGHHHTAVTAAYGTARRHAPPPLAADTVRTRLHCVRMCVHCVRMCVYSVSVSRLPDGCLFSDSPHALRRHRDRHAVQLRRGRHAHRVGHQRCAELDWADTCIPQCMFYYVLYCTLIELHDVYRICSFGS